MTFAKAVLRVPFRKCGSEGQASGRGRDLELTRELAFAILRRCGAFLIDTTPRPMMRLTLVMAFAP